MVDSHAARWALSTGVWARVCVGEGNSSGDRRFWAVWARVCVGEGNSSGETGDSRAADSTGPYAVSRGPVAISNQRGLVDAGG